MSQSYTALEGTLTVRGATTTTRTGEIDAVAVVGGHDSASSSATAGETTHVDDPTSSEDTFGTSELSRATQAIAANDVGTIVGVPVSETETTESASSTSSLTLSNTPLFDPNVHPDHDITVTDTDAGSDLSVNIVYDSSPSTPSDADTANVNPINGEVVFDASGNYDVTYTYGNYQTAIQAAVDAQTPDNVPVRNVIVLTESPSVKSTLVTELQDIAADFDFKRGFVGAQPNIASGEISNYTPDEQNWRLVEVAPARGTGADGEVRTCAAVGGFMSTQPIGPDGSGLYDQVGGLSALNKEYRSSDVKDFDGVTALTRNAIIGTAVTTSTDAQFQNIYATEIIDEVALDLFGTVRSYAGGPQDIDELETLLEVQCQSNTEGSPPNLGFAVDTNDRPYDVGVSPGSDNTIANASVSIVPYPIAEEVNLNLTVADGYVEFDGVN